MKMFKGFSYVAVGLVLGLWPSSAFSGSVEEASGAMSRAYNDYYDALKKNPTQAESARLSKEILAPARQSLQSAIVDQNKASASGLKGFKVPVPEVKASAAELAAAKAAGGSQKSSQKSSQTAGKDSAQEAKKASNGPSGAGLYSAKGKAVPTPAATEESPKEEVVIDGNAIPREIEFPGKKKK